VHFCTAFWYIFGLRLTLIKQRADYQPFISDLSELKNETIALGRRHSFLKSVFENYPNLNYREVNSVEDGLKGVASGEYEAALVTLNTGTYNIAKHGLHNLQVVGKLVFEMDLGFQVKKEYAPFVGILNKALSSITQEERQRISNKWTNIEVKNRIVSKYMWIFIALIAFLLILFFYINYELKKKVAKSTSELSKLLNSFDEYIIASKTDLDGNIIYVSKAFCKISGYSSEELIGKNHRIIKHPDNNPDIYTDLWGTIKNGKI